MVALRGGILSARSSTQGGSHEEKVRSDRAGEEGPYWGSHGCGSVDVDALLWWLRG